MSETRVRLPPSLSWNGLYLILRPWGLKKKTAVDEPGPGYVPLKKERVVLLSYPDGFVLDKITSDIQSPPGVKLCAKK